MVTSVFKLKFSCSSYDLNNDYERLSEHEKERISELDAETYFDYNDDDDCYVCYIITKPMEMENYLRILRSNLIECHCEDISSDVITHKVDLVEELKHLISVTNQIKWSFFVDDLNDWIYKNLDIDNILDRISEVGVDSLTSVEKEFLKEYKV